LPLFPVTGRLGDRAKQAGLHRYCGMPTCWGGLDRSLRSVFPAELAEHLPKCRVFLTAFLN
jgi:hypothetical protein